ncbi:MAG: chemotaxis-specific protein-glutamate methyltransferase CheB [Bacteroidales bacterium]|nr:chemotaxis-specific protein-glutamate methyltransferase CheB [Bacteroidales bacterium]
MIKVLIVEDSPVMQQTLEFALKSDPEISIIGIASDGIEALELLQRKKPDIITMDVNMPRMNGFETTRKIMETDPIPIVIITGSWDVQDVRTSFLAIEAGAVSILGKPKSILDPEYDQIVKNIINTIKLMSEVKLVTRVPAREKKVEPVDVSYDHQIQKQKYELLALGASTGGPPLIYSMLSQLSKQTPFPILIVQHIAEGFTNGFRDWLDDGSNLPVHIAKDREKLLPGHVYLAPDGHQMGVNWRKEIVITKDLPENNLRPAVSYLFRSVAETYGDKAIGVILSGMGKDGAQELKMMNDKGAFTIAQEEKSCVVFGMPKVAIELGGVDLVLTPDKIIEVINEITHKSNRYS